jgi:hypothetical protein
MTRGCFRPSFVTGSIFEEFRVARKWRKPTCGWIIEGLGWSEGVRGFAGLRIETAGTLILFVDHNDD